ATFARKWSVFIDLLAWEMIGIFFWISTRITETRLHPQKQWRKWSEAARAAFNDLYAMMYENQKMITHPRMKKIKAAHWKTVAWNPAWLAADRIDGKFGEER